MLKLEDIKYRIDITGDDRNGKAYAVCLVYIDARTAMRELENLGYKDYSYGWDMAVGYEGGAVKGKLAVGDRSIEEVGYPNRSDQPIKDAVSDAFKRCAVHFGVGRELYDAPTLFTYGVVKGSNGKIKKLSKEGDLEIQKKIKAWWDVVSASYFVEEAKAKKAHLK
jgi:hypothetical protein